MPDDNNMKKLDCLIITCQPYPNKAIQNSDVAKEKKKKQHSEVLIFQTLFSHSTVVLVNKVSLDNVQIAVQEKNAFKKYF